ncbi:MAG: TIGR04282 family arsenosugar biosynthesis glycosyltransferase [Defluviicoccus sp.]|nr:MAG: TIGR04282 family arsenosugar biosynthesis glycosyltransferase [Defluviicoccus sp.]
MRQDDIALAIMCKAPADGSCKTRLCPPLSAGEAAGLSRCFIADVVAVIDAVSPRSGVAVYTPADARAAFDDLLPASFRMLAQRGADLSQRLLHATEDLLSWGFRGVCLINSDSPTLPAAVLRAAMAALSQPGNRIVLGPAIDGGYYLIGLKQLEPALFQDISWSTSHVLAETLTRAAGLAPVEMLPLWYDVDDAGTLQLLLQELFGAGNPLSGVGLVSGTAAHSRSYLRSLLRENEARCRLGRSRNLTL